MSLQQRWGHYGGRNGLEDGGGKPMVRDLVIYRSTQPTGIIQFLLFELTLRLNEPVGIETRVPELKPEPYLSPFKCL